MKFQRSRRLRMQKWLRNLFIENTISSRDLIYPIFISESTEPIIINNLTLFDKITPKEAAAISKKAYQLGIQAIMLFPSIPQNLKDNHGSYAFSQHNIIFQAIKEIKNTCPEIGIIADVALDPYTIHGHDGILDASHNLLNDATVDALVKQAHMLVDAGVDALSPSDMCDGRILAIRQSLSQSKINSINNHLLSNYPEYIPIFSYSAKFSSHLYKPFRYCVQSDGLLKGNKLNYQISPSQSSAAIQKIEADIEEGADAIIIKPSMFYNDVVFQANQYLKPIIIYQTSGEYAMMKAAEFFEVCDYVNIMLESLISSKRSGANACITYGALEIAQYLKEHDLLE